MLGLYIPRNSPIHALPAGVKLVGLAIAGVGTFWMSSWVGLLAMLGLALLLVSIARLPWGVVAAQLRPMAWILAGIFLLHAFVHHWTVGLVIVLRFAVLLVLATVMTLTSRVSEMVAALERGLAPLKPLGIRPAQISLMVAIAIRLIPLILDQIQEVRDAQRARGVDAPLITLFVPVLIRVLQVADHLADALDARGYDSNDEDGAG